VAAAALALQRTPYDAGNAEHEVSRPRPSVCCGVHRLNFLHSTIACMQAMLEALWAALKPGVSRQGGRVTSEWGEVGFQGKDPASDFRYDWEKGIGRRGDQMVKENAMMNIDLFPLLRPPTNPSYSYP